MNQLDLSGLAPAYVIEALFATITYRLEPDGKGTRFPLIVDRHPRRRQSWGGSKQSCAD